MDEIVTVRYNGEIIEVKVPAGSTPAQIQQFVEQRVKKGPATPKSEQVGRFRDLGYSDKEIGETVNPPSATEGMGEYEKYRAGLGAFLTNTAGAIGQVAARNIPEMDESKVDDWLREHLRVQQTGGLADEPAAKFANAVATGATLLAPASTYARLGLPAASVLEGATMTAMTPTFDENFWTSKGKQLGTETAFAGGANMAAKLGLDLYQGARNAPRALYDFTEKPASGRPIVRASGADIAEGNRLADRTGVQLSPAERSNAPAARQLEQYVSESLITRGQVEEINRLKGEQLETGLNRYADSLGPNAPREVVASKIQSFVEDNAKKLMQERHLQANRDYGPIVSDPRPVRASNYANELQTIVAEGKLQGASQDMIQAAKQAEAKLKQLQESGMNITGRDVDLLTRANDVNRMGTVWDVQHPSMQAGLNNRIRDAVEQDLRIHDPQLAAQLDLAKKNYTEASRAIDSLEMSGLGKIVGKEVASDITGIVANKIPPAKVLDRLDKLDPVDMLVVRQYLERNAPEIMDDYRALKIREALKAARINPATGRSTGDVNPAAFLQMMGVRGSAKTRMMNMEHLEAVYGGTPGFEQLMDFIEVSRRLADSTGRNTSGTAIRAETQGWINGATNLASMTWEGVKRAGGTLATMAGLRGYANRMDPRSAQYMGGAPKYELPANARRVQTLPAIPALIGSSMLEDE